MSDLTMQRLHQGEGMAPLTIDLRGITPDLLHATDSSALTDAVQDAISPTQPMVDGGGFDNKCAAQPTTLATAAVLGPSRSG
ncbi:MAG: hypothetical protein ACRDOO_26775 [Actinomadura sp.]